MHPIGSPHFVVHHINVLRLGTAAAAAVASAVYTGHEVVGVECAESAAWQLQRDSWLKFETSQGSPAAGGAADGRRPEFIAASTFERRRHGYVFKTDAKGTGYYLDSKAVKVTTVVVVGYIAPSTSVLCHVTE